MAEIPLVEVQGDIEGFTPPINSTISFYRDDPLVTLGDGTVWLRSGVLEGDITKYPNAVKTNFGFFGNRFPVSQATSQLGAQLTVKDGNFFIMNYDNATVYEYTKEGLYTGKSWDLSAEITDLGTIFWDGTHFWVSDGTADVVKQFDSDFTYTTVEKPIASNVGCITYDGTTYYAGEIGGSGGTATIHKYDQSFNDLNDPVDVSADITELSGLVWDGTYFWIMDSYSGFVNPNRIVKYLSDLTKDPDDFEYNYREEPDVGIRSEFDMAFDGANLCIMNCNPVYYPDGGYVNKVQKESIGIVESLKTQNGNVYVRVQ